jgi:cytochrome c-type biogenesis protein CcsB
MLMCRLTAVFIHAIVFAGWALPASLFADSPKVTAIVGNDERSRMSLPLPTDLDTSAIAAIPVQTEGRVAPFDTLARHSVAEVTGRERWQGHDPNVVILSWTFQPQRWVLDPLIKVEHEPLKQAVGLPVERRHFSLQELIACAGLQNLIEAGFHAQQSGRSLDALQRQAAQISNRMGLLQAFLHGQAIAMVPDPRDPSAAWSSPAQSGRSIHRSDARSEIQNHWASVSRAFTAHDSTEFENASSKLAAALHGLDVSAYPTHAAMLREMHYNRVHPFRWAWVFMAASMVAGIVALALRKGGTDNRVRLSVSDWLTLALITAGAALFLYGLILRWLIAERAPLSNMYESLVVLAGGAAVFALFFFAFTRQRLILPVAAAVSGVGFILADVLPLDAAITTLPPVLRNTVWLTIHVLTIMLGYSAAALSLGLAHVQLGFLTLAPKRTKQAKEAMRLNYWAILMAVIFLTAGIVFGAVWANASWGRYWGWDPKETWSLIALFGYLGLLHARYTGWLRDFGTAVASIVCFQLVLMTYYGVNYVLGTGLHSYGFGAGGIGWVLAYLAVQTALVALAAWRYRALTAAQRAPSDAQVRRTALPTT